MVIFSSRVCWITGRPRRTLKPWPEWSSVENSRRMGWRFGRGKVSWVMNPKGRFKAA